MPPTILPLMLAGVSLALGVAGALALRAPLQLRGRAHRLRGDARRRLPTPDGSSRADRLEALLAAGRRWPPLARLEQRLAALGLGVDVRSLVVAGTGAALLLLTALLALGAPFGLALAIAAVALFTGARLLLDAAMARRRRRFRAQLPEALGLMVRALRAGVPVGEAVHGIGAESEAPLGQVFRRAHQQARLGQPLEAALADASAAFDSAPMRILLVTLAIQRETGGNLAANLQGLETILRDREKLALKVRAMSAEARTSALIIGSLPVAIAVLMALVAPDYLAPLFATTAGHVLLGAAAASLAAGGLVMARLVRVER
jgi:tight adherence protein B